MGILGTWMPGRPPLGKSTPQTRSIPFPPTPPEPPFPPPPPPALCAFPPVILFLFF
ncbi:hypothetical protein ACFQZF_04840 [Flavobacterium myungsuense]|uniref:Uncharacterized protein n=1 Tax=Flavobacterium myungsuense TaxID=651823 RepID=A0ABW3IYM8_9FLAO